MKICRLMILRVGVLVALLPAGCGCLSTQRVHAKIEQLRFENRARAEPAMLAAAKSRGAVLLSLEPQHISQHLACVNGGDESASSASELPHNICFLMEGERSGCEERAGDGRTFLIRRQGAKPKLAIPIQQVEGSFYARLAQRGNKLFVLLPRLTTQEEVGTATECECDGMPRVQCPSTFGFVLDEAPSSPEVEEIWVPMAEQHFRTICKATAV